MPQRFLRPGITNSEHWNNVSFGAQSLYIRLLTLVDDYGRYDARSALVRSHAFPVSEISKDEVETMMDELEREEMLVLYNVDGKDYLQLSRWEERARGASKYPTPPGADDDSQPRGTVYFIQGETTQKVKIGYTHWRVESRMAVLQTGATEKLRLLGSMEATQAEERALHRHFAGQNVGGEWFTPSTDLLSCAQDAAIARKYLLPQPSPPVISHKPKAIVPKPSPSAASAAGFDEFWQAYPRRVAKPDAERAWAKHKCAEILPQILESIGRAKQSAFWKKDAGQFIPYPATWLNQHGWGDELEPVTSSTSDPLAKMRSV